MVKCNIQIAGAAVEALWCYRDAPGPQIIFSRRKGTCLFGRSPNKNDIIVFSVKMKCSNYHSN